MKKYAPKAQFVFHNAQPITKNTENYSNWNDMFPDDDMENVVMDMHIYQAWAEPETVEESCTSYHEVIAANVKDVKYPVWVGEWSLATDTCAFWLGGFNSGGGD